MKLMRGSGVRRFENAFTGAQATTAGHALAFSIGVGMTMAPTAKKAIDLQPERTRKAPGIHQAPAMNQDMKRNPTMGASGALSLALSDVNNPLKR